MTTVKGTLNVDEAVTLDSTLDVTGVTTLTSSSSNNATLEIDNTGNGHAMSITLSNTLSTGQTALEVNVGSHQEHASHSPAISVNLHGTNNEPSTGLLGNSGITSNHGSVIMSTHGVSGIGIQCENSSYGNLICTASRIRLIDTPKTHSNTPGLRPIDIGTGSTIGNLTLANGSITDSSGAISFGNENLSTTGTLDVSGDTSVATLDSSGATSLATNGGVVNLASTGVMTKVKGTLNVDEAVTLDTTLDVNGAVNLNNTTQSTSSTTGALIVDGGVGIARDVFIAGGTTITGDATASQFVTSSDRRLKKNIRVIKDCLGKVKKIRGVNFTWIKNGKKDFGVIAQEIEKVAPFAVKEDEEGMKKVDYGRLAPLFIQSIKEQQQIIEDQQEEIDGLKEQFEDLKAKVSELLK